MTLRNDRRSTACRRPRPTKLDRLIEAVGRLAPPPAAGGRLRRRRLLRLVGRAGHAGAGATGQPRRHRPDPRRRPGARHPGRQHASVSPPACPPTTCCCGARAAWASRRWSRRCMPRSTQPETADKPLKLVEIHREDIDTLPRLMAILKAAPYRFILFCDDLSFDHDDTSYKSLKAALEGGVEGRPANVIFYATSNRRHLLPRDMIDNERSTAINPSRGGRGEGVAVRPLRPVARLPQMLAGRISRHDRRLCRAITG